MNHRPVLIVKTGSTLPGLRARRGDFPLWFADGMALAAEDVELADAQSGDLPDPGAHRAVVLTGSPAMVTHREDWMEAAAEWLRRVLDQRVAVLGVCFGHQLLAFALGGEVGANPGGREIGTVALRLARAAADDLLFRGLPPEFPVHMTHMECVLRLPPGAARLAATDKDANAAFNLPGKRVWGVQFHPEFDEDIMRGYLEGRGEQLAQEGLDQPALLQQVRPAACARGLLHRFKSLI